MAHIPAFEKKMMHIAQDTETGVVFAEVRI